jgi:hypothetical protein
MIQFLRDKYNYVHGTFHGSETILWARINMFIGAAFAAAQATDLSPIFANPKYLTFWLVFSNLVTEMGRRRNAEYEPDGKIK